MRFKSIHSITLLSVVFALVLNSTVVTQRASGSETVEVQIGKLSVLLPTSITITGNEIGLSERSCLISVVISSKPNEFIPLRGGVKFSLEDSIGTTIDSGYYEALVEDINRAEVRGVFRCNNTNATLKPPYILRVAPFGRSAGDEKRVAVTVNFVKSTPTPQVTATIKPTPAPSVYGANPLDESLKNQIIILKNQISLLEKKIKKICSAKPKPKGC